MECSAHRPVLWCRHGVTVCATRARGRRADPPSSWQPSGAASMIAQQGASNSSLLASYDFAVDPTQTPPGAANLWFYAVPQLNYSSMMSFTP